MVTDKRRWTLMWRIGRNVHVSIRSCEQLSGVAIHQIRGCEWRLQLTYHQEKMHYRFKQNASDLGRIFYKSLQCRFSDISSKSISYCEPFCKMYKLPPYHLHPSCKLQVLLVQVLLAHILLPPSPMLLHHRYHHSHQLDLILMLYQLLSSLKQ